MNADNEALFQSAPEFITPGNVSDTVYGGSGKVSIRPGVHHPGERASGAVRTVEDEGVSIRPGVHHPGERSG